MRWIVLLLVMSGGCARLGAGMNGFSKGIQSANADAKRHQVCRPSPYVAGERICEDE